MVFVVWRNYVQWRSERRRAAPPGVAIGAVPRRHRVAELLHERLFPWKARLNGWLARCYYGRLPTRCLGGRDRVHDLAYAT